MRPRMSSSSSTTRTSDAIGNPFLLIHCSFVFQAFLFCRKHEANLGSLLFGVSNGDFAAMVFHDLAHDGKAEARSLRARRDIRLGQTMTMFRRQTDSIVRDDERYAFRRCIEHDAYVTGRIIFFGVTRLYRFDGVL